MKLMAKVFGVFGAIVFICMAVGPISYLWTPQTGDVITMQRIKANYDTIANGINRLCDTVNGLTARVTAIHGDTSAASVANVGKMRYRDYISNSGPIIDYNIPDESNISSPINGFSSVVEVCMPQHNSDGTITYYWSVIGGWAYLE